MKGYLATGRADVTGTLLQLELFSNLPDGGTVARSVLATDAHLFSSLGHLTNNINININ